MAQKVKNLPVMWGTWVRSLGWKDPLERLPTPVFCLENSTDRIVHGVPKSWTLLSEFHFHFHVVNLKNKSTDISFKKLILEKQ